MSNPTEVDLEGKNIVLIVADTLTAFHLPSYVYDRDTAPFLTRLAEQNIQLENAYSNAPWTAPSHASIFSGKLPSDHGTTTDSVFFEENSFVEELKEKGYNTVGISANDLVSEGLGFDRGFESFHEVFSFETETSEDFMRSAIQALHTIDLETFKKGIKFTYNKIRGSSNRGAENIERIVSEEVKTENAPNFLFINYTEVHLPYNAPKEYVERFSDKPEEKISEHMSDYYDLSNPEKIYQGFENSSDQDLVDLYDASIRYLDSKLESLYNYLDEELDDFVFIVTSDHGENFGEHGVYFHQAGVWEKSIKVPLIIAGESINPQTIEENFSLRRIRELVLQGKINTTETVYSQYNGWNNLLKLDEDRENNTDEEGKKYLLNESKAVVKGDKGYVSNTELSDFQFIRNQKCYSKENQCFDSTDELRTKIDIILGD